MMRRNGGFQVMGRDECRGTRVPGGRKSDEEIEWDIINTILKYENNQIFYRKCVIAGVGMRTAGCTGV